jgi:hypothetical protein
MPAGHGNKERAAKPFFPLAKTIKTDNLALLRGRTNKKPSFILKGKNP